jgi:hypothetical protein
MKDSSPDQLIQEINEEFHGGDPKKQPDQYQFYKGLRIPIGSDLPAGDIAWPAGN